MENRLRLFNTALACIGKDMAPQEDDLACMEALNAVFKKAFEQEIGGGLSTYRAYQILRKDKRFEKTLVPLAGDIIISPTGYGNGKLRNGHAGIVGEKEKVMSNTSANGLWQENYTLETWKRRYKTYGGFPMDYFRVVTPPAPIIAPPVSLTPEQKASILSVLWAFVQDLDLVNRVRALLGGAPTFGAARDSGWSKASKAHLKIQNISEISGKKRTLLNPLVIHHIIPVHIDKSLEMIPSNWVVVTLWEHLVICHLGSWHSFNPNLREDIIIWRNKYKNRP